MLTILEIDATRFGYPSYFQTHIFGFGYMLRKLGY